MSEVLGHFLQALRASDVRVSTAEGTALKARFPLGDGKPTGFLAFGSPLASEGHSAPVAAAGTPAAGNVAERRG